MLAIGKQTEIVEVNAQVNLLQPNNPEMATDVPARSTTRCP